MSDQREQDRNIETEAGWPTGHEMIRQLREALGLPDVALPIPPQQVWEEALAQVRRLVARAASVTPLPPPGTQRLHCTACGHVFLDVLASAAPTGCPACGGRSWRVGGAASPMWLFSGAAAVPNAGAAAGMPIPGPGGGVSPARGPAGP